MNATETVSTSGGLYYNEVLFALAIVAFIVLVVMEKRHPFREFPAKIFKESFSTNTTAFLVNNLILSTLSASSLFLVAQQFASHGLLSGLDNGPVKWILAFAFFDLAIYPIFSHFCVKIPFLGLTELLLYDIS